MNADMLNRGTEDPQPPFSLSLFFFFFLGSRTPPPSAIYDLNRRKCLLTALCV